MTDIKLRPQPIGIFPLPVGYLLLPPSEMTPDHLMQGLPMEAYPDAWQFYAHAMQGNTDAAYAALADDDSAIAQYNRFVLQSSPQEYQRLRSTFDDTLTTVLDVVAYSIGYIDAPPTTDAVTDELQAFVMMAQATYAIEIGNFGQAQQILSQAIGIANTVTPVFAAQLMGTLADTMRQSNVLDATILKYYQDAIARIEKTALRSDLGGLYLNLGTAYHEMSRGQRGVLMQAVKCYQQATRILNQHAEPELYALGQNNLALAYLAMPMVEASDQLRMGIAVQALREALTIYTRETHPHMWSSAQLNLANALQYLPSTHTGDNLVQAVEIYEELLDFRSVDADPVGYARLLSNQANALAHLGIFDHALVKLSAAHALFLQNRATDLAQAIQEMIESVQAAQAEKEAAEADAQAKNERVTL